MQISLGVPALGVPISLASVARGASGILRVFLRMGYYLIRGRSSAKAEFSQRWARETIADMGFELVCSNPDPSAGLQEPTIFVGNHISYMDIPVVHAMTGAAFLAKVEVSRWPIIGRCGNLLNTVWVSRDSKESRSGAREIIASALWRGQSIVVFPSGTTTLSESQAWRRGIFEIAASTGVKVCPFRLSYSPLRACAFVEQDLLLPHLFLLAALKEKRVQLEFGLREVIVDPGEAADRMLSWVRGPVVARAKQA